MRTIRRISTVAVTAALVLASAAAAGPAEPTLEARAVLPALTFAPGPPSGTLIGPGPINGVSLPFASQPVQGFSGILPAGNGEYLVLEDNGYGAKSNSADFLLRIYRVAPHWETAGGGPGTVDVKGFIGLRDPDHKVPWPIVNGATSERLLTGADFDPESFERDRNGDFWIGEEFGPFILHTDATGRLLEAPIPLPGVKSPQNPTLAPGETPNLPASGGFEGMAMSKDGRTLYPMLEKALTTDPVQTRRFVYEFDIASRKYTGRTWQYRTDAPSYSMTDLVALDEHRFVTIERDTAEGAAAQFKRVFVVDLREVDAAGFLVKRQVVDLLHIADPALISLPARPGDIGLGNPFTMPFVTTEALWPLDGTRLVIVNDNNLPFSHGRNPSLPDDNEFVIVRTHSLHAPG